MVRVPSTGSDPVPQALREQPRQEHVGPQTDMGTGFLAAVTLCERGGAE